MMDAEDPLIPQSLIPMSVAGDQFLNYIAETQGLTRTEALHYALAFAVQSINTWNKPAAAKWDAECAQE